MGDGEGIDIRRVVQNDWDISLKGQRIVSRVLNPINNIRIIAFELVEMRGGQRQATATRKASKMARNYVWAVEEIDIALAK